MYKRQEGIKALGLATTDLVGELEPGGAEVIAQRRVPDTRDDEALDDAAMEFGAD